MWPRTPQSVEPAYVHGALFDLAAYPALIPGNDKVLGEVWSFDPADVPATLRTLDRIEGFGQGQPDLYVREVVPCRLSDGGSCQSYAYFYANPSHLADEQRVAPGTDGFCGWPQRGT